MPKSTAGTSDGLILRPLIKGPRIQGRLRSMGKLLSKRYAGRSPLAVVVMDGAAFFACDLLRMLAIPNLRIHFMGASSYHGGTSSSGTVRLHNLPDCADEDILLIDDILDSGLTLRRIHDQLSTQGCAEIFTCVLLDKPQGRQTPFSADLVGFTVPQVFLVGYGLDYQQRLRHLPDICVCELAQSEAGAAPGAA